MKDQQTPQPETNQEQITEEQFKKNFEKVQAAMEVVREHTENLVIIGTMKGEKIGNDERRGALLLAEGDIDELGEALGRLSQQHRQVRPFISALEHMMEAVNENSGRSAGGGLAEFILDAMLATAKKERDRRKAEEAKGTGNGEAKPESSPADQEKEEKN